MKSINVAVTGAAGQIGYSLLFRLASGEVFGKDTQVHLKLLELPQAISAAEGVALELDDCAFSNLASVNAYSDPKQAFDGVHWALLVGSRPRSKGMERADLIECNGPIFVEQGKALLNADQSLQTVVVGNPCNTNALIALKNCADIDSSRFTAMTSLDENRAKAQLANRARVSVKDVGNLSIWGNHSPTMVPDFENATIKGQPVLNLIDDRNWLENNFLQTVQQRGAQIIAARGSSSAASAASACIDHIKNFINVTPSGQWFSAAVLTTGGEYDIPKDLVFSFPIRSMGEGKYEVARNLPLSSFCQEKIKLTKDELLKEREIIKSLL